jgi:hypothetical protein
MPLLAPTPACIDVGTVPPACTTTCFDVCLQKYLSDEEFKSVLKMTRDEFNKLPKWKQNDTKKKAELF